MEIIGFFSTLERARAARSEMLASGFDPVEVGIYGGSVEPPEEVTGWFSFADEEHRETYRRAIERGAAAVVVELSNLHRELNDGEVAVEILERHEPVDAEDWTEGRPSRDKRSIATWRPAKRPVKGKAMREGLECYGVARSPAESGAIPRFLKEFVSDPRHCGRDWNAVESDLREQFDRRYPGTPWDAFKDRLQRGYDRAR